MKKVNNFRVSKNQLTKAKKLTVALLLIGTGQFMVGCFSYKAMMAPAADTAARRSELVKRVTPGRKYEIALNDGRKVEIKVSTITAEAIFGAMALKDANGDILRNRKNKVVTVQNYRVLLSEIADIRERRINGGETAIAIAVPIAIFMLYAIPKVADAAVSNFTF